MHHDSITLCQRRVSWRNLVKKNLRAAYQFHPCTRDIQLPKPKFKIGQHICHQWTNDDSLDPRCGTTYRDYGLIVGMFYGMRNRYVCGWVYQISFYRMESSDRFELPYLDEVEEDEVRAV